MLVHVTGGKNEAIHLFIGNRQWGILPVVVQFEVIIIVTQIRNGWCVVDIFLSLLCCGIGKQQIGDEGLQVPLPLSFHILLYHLLGYVCVSAVIHQEIRSLIFPSV